MMEAIEPSPAPVMVKSNPEPVMVPALLKVKVPELEPMVDALPKVIKPDKELVPSPVNAPAPPTPVPLMVTASLPTATPLIFNVAPEVTDVLPVVEPSALAFAATNVPAVTLVAPS